VEIEKKGEETISMIELFIFQRRPLQYEIINNTQNMVKKKENKRL
jgi:hypothetical protein